MKAFYLAIVGVSALAVTAAGIAFAAQRSAPPMRAADIEGTYELIDRVMASGKVLKPPDIAALYTMVGGRANLNLFVRNADGSLASESSIIRYRLTDTAYCEWIEYTARNNLDAPGVTNIAPSVSEPCTPIKIIRGAVVFAPPGESVSTTYTREGFTATIKGQFTDHWKKVG